MRKRIRNLVDDIHAWFWYWFIWHPQWKRDMRELADINKTLDALSKRM